MIAKLSFWAAFFVVFLSLLPQPILALEDPLKVPNNKFGVHILFPSEITDAASLVNGNGGEWGYVTIPIQDTDMDLVKWQAFMDNCKKLHVIPLIRLATEGDYFNTQDWRRPNYNDIIDFANFLNSLDWPTKNRYVIIYNEVNRGDEFGGSVDPQGYADLLDYAVKEFKYVNPDFFVISAGLDNASPNQGTTFMNEYQFYEQMNEAVPGIFSKIDGMASHSYPNPDFVQPPSDLSHEGIYSFHYEQQLLDSLGGKNLPVFITETGWTDDIISDATIADYYKEALANAWSDPSIVAITPFLLRAGQGNFVPFSLIKPDGGESHQYTFLQTISKTKGSPILNSSQVLAASSQKTLFEPKTKSFPSTSPTQSSMQLPNSVRYLLKWLLKI